VSIQPGYAFNRHERLPTGVIDMAFLGKKTAVIGLALASTLALGGCYDDGYGYGGVSMGYGPGGYYGYDSPYYGGYGYPAYGWYEDFYYPGTGYYVFDSGGRRHRWNDRQRRYWEGRRDNGHARDDRRPPPRGVNNPPRGTNPPRGRDTPPRVVTPRPDRNQARPDRGSRAYQSSIRAFSQPGASAPAPSARPDRPNRGTRSDRGRGGNR